MGEDEREEREEVAEEATPETPTEQVEQRTDDYDGLARRIDEVRDRLDEVLSRIDGMRDALDGIAAMRLEDGATPGEVSPADIAADAAAQAVTEILGIDALDLM